jgi:hypothetical protein
MQRIEYRRHRAELAEVRSATGSQAFQEEMAEIARNWRDLARELEQLHRDAGAPPSQTIKSKP